MFDDTIEAVTVIRQALAPLRISRLKMTKLFLYQMARSASPADLALSIALVAISVCMLCYFFSTKTKAEILNLPVIGAGTDHKYDFDKVVEQGAKKYPNDPYLVKSSGFEYVVFPSNMFDEIKRLPEEIASIQAFFDGVTFGKYTNIGKESHGMIKAISVDLSRHIPTKVIERQEDCYIAALSLFGHCDDWIGVELMPTMLKLVSRMNGSSFLGRKVGNTASWANLMYQFLLSMMLGVMFMKKVPNLFVPVCAPVVFLWNKINYWRLEKIIYPLIKEDLTKISLSVGKDEELTTSSLISSTDTSRIPFTEWLVRRHDTRPDIHRLFLDFILTSFEATPSQSALLYNVALDLAMNPNVANILREEIAAVCDKNGSLPSTSLGELEKMDSVMKESFRANSFSLFALHRRVCQPVKLSRGPLLPKGTYLCVDSYSINLSQEFWGPHPEKYEPFRFYRLRQEDPENSNRHLFVSMSKSSPNFGDGNQACPGRVYAANTIKIILTHLLRNYDFKLAAGQGRPDRHCMPNGSFVPDFKAKVLFKSRNPDHLTTP